MTKYILAAEADKIQDLIFRSAHLREVVGGSQLLSDFCREMPKALDLDEENIVINDGGSFTLLFENEDDAHSFGETLAEAYRQMVGGSFTIAKPVSVNGNFGDASREAQRNLQAAKRDRQNTKTTTPHLPYQAFCASCGVGLAQKHQKLHDNDNEAQYFCPSCLQKSDKWEKNRLGDFLGPFYQKLEQRVQANNIPIPEDVGKLDPRNYVAYLLADGNSMGEVFGKCRDRKQLKKLSRKLTKVTRASLVKVTRLLMEHPDVWEKTEEKVPVLPLILGGDDLFALLPASWAIDFARRFAQEYEEGLSSVFSDLEIDAHPTLGVAVVICKAKYPYYLAHARGDELLKQAKRMGKSWAKISDEPPRSTINFEVILGNQLTVEEMKTEHRDTLRPFWIGTQDVGGWGISIDHLLTQRLKLKELPRRRLAQLRAIFDELPSQSNEQHKRSLQRLEKLVQRITKISDDTDTVAQALDALGGRTSLYKVGRVTDRKSWEGHALPDLLDAWDFTYNLKESVSDYRGGNS